MGGSWTAPPRPCKPLGALWALIWPLQGWREHPGVEGWGMSPSSPCLLLPLNLLVHPPPERTAVLLHNQGPSPLLVQPPPLLHLPLHPPQVLPPARAKLPLGLPKLCLVLPAPAARNLSPAVPLRATSGQGTGLGVGDVVGCPQGAAQPRRCWRPWGGHSSCSGSPRERKRSGQKPGHAPLVPGLWLGAPRGD